MTVERPVWEAVRLAVAHFADHGPVGVDVEEDSRTALGQPHHCHRLDLVARRLR